MFQTPDLPPIQDRNQKTTPKHKRFGWAPGNGAMPMKKHEADLDAYTATLPKFFLANQTESTEGKRFAPWDLVMPKIMKRPFFDTLYQEIGDCVGAGMAQAMWYIQPIEIALGEFNVFRYIHPSFAYGTSRMIAGFPFSGDGSTGTYMMQAATRIGHLGMDLPNVPKYSGALSRKWGKRPGPEKEFIDLAAPHKSILVVRLTSVTQVRDFISGRKGLVTIASMRGFSMSLEQNTTLNKSFFKGNDSWPHQMCIIAWDDDPRRPAGCRLNSWGPNAHGKQLDGPPGSGWQDADSLEKELRQPGTECYGFSQFDSFAETGIDYRALPLLR